MIDPTTFEPWLAWIDRQHGLLVEHLIRLAGINSGSRNPAGIARLADELESLFESLAAPVERIGLPPVEELDGDGNRMRQTLGPALRLRKRPHAPLRVLLVGHMDTVYGPEHPFQEARMLDGDRLSGPGVADLKGGLLVMLTALRALEHTPWADSIGWEVILNPDEELGSPGSASLLAESAGRSDLGLVYEPAMPDGMLAGARRGSGTFAAVIRGRAAHAGREHHLGRNAIRAAADLVAAVDDLNGRRPGVTVNVGFVQGGGPVNMVPDRALVRFNFRFADPADEGWIGERLETIRNGIDTRDGIGVELHGGFGRPPKILDAAHRRLLEMVRDCGGSLGMELSWRDTGGCCDGNNLSAAGLPNVDTLGVVGGGIHSSDEYVELRSLTQRARLSALLLMGLASGELPWPPGRRGPPA